MTILLLKFVQLDFLLFSIHPQIMDLLSTITIYSLMFLKYLVRLRLIYFMMMSSFDFLLLISLLLPYFLQLIQLVPLISLQLCSLHLFFINSLVFSFFLSMYKERKDFNLYFILYLLVHHQFHLHPLIHLLSYHLS